MGGRRIYHARGKVLGGSSSINGMIFQRGNPLDYERWGADPGMESWDYAHCLPYFKRRWRTASPRRRTTRSAAIPARSRSSGPATNPLFQAFFDATVQAGYPRTVRRQRLPAGGLRAKFDRNVSRGRRLSAARAYLHPVLNRRTSSWSPRRSCTRVIFDGKRATGVEYKHRPAAQRRTRGGQRARRSCAAARSTPRSCCSSRASGNAAELGALGIESRGRPARRRREHAGPPRGVHPVQVHAAGVDAEVHEAAATCCRSAPSGSFLRKGPGATNHFEGGGFARSNDDVAYPNLMFHFLPIAVRYDGSAPASGDGYQVHIGPMYSDARGSVKITSRDPSGETGATLQLPVDRAGPARMGRGDPGRPRHPQPAGDGTVQRRRDVTPGTVGRRPTSRSSIGSPRTARRRCTRPAPRRWAPIRWRSSIR